MQGVSRAHRCAEAFGQGPSRHTRYNSCRRSGPNDADFFFSPVRNLQWRFVVALFTGELVYAIIYSPPPATIDGKAATSAAETDTSSTSGAANEVVT